LTLLYCAFGGAVAERPKSRSRYVRWGREAMSNEAGEQLSKTGGSYFVSKVLGLKSGAKNGLCFH